jgi:hypothetical protein
LKANTGKGMYDTNEMDEKRESPVLNYASPEPRSKAGELGALPALACLLLGFFGLVSLLLAAVCAGNIITSTHFPGADETEFFVVGLAALALGVFAIWGAGYISRTYRSIR